MASKIIFYKQNFYIQSNVKLNFIYDYGILN